MFKKSFAKIALVAASLAALASNAFAVDPVSMAEVATQTTTGLANNTFLYAIMGAIMAIQVALILYYRGKKVAK